MQHNKIQHVWTNLTIYQPEIIFKCHHLNSNGQSSKSIRRKSTVLNFSKMWKMLTENGRSFESKRSKCATVKIQGDQSERSWFMKLTEVDNAIKKRLFGTVHFLKSSTLSLLHQVHVVCYITVQFKTQGPFALNSDRLFDLTRPTEPSQGYTYDNIWRGGFSINGWHWHCGT